ncbi:hypothetical protein A6F65_02174 [Paraurantiacibacter namhicola]|uniref:Bacterial membrane flanked domain protein n=2 Tax=Paraurantiacibacter namhicola TaxID=645517 RepID=A0A1C7DAD1_9SPHN|nr:hypothetical protein A6F65_02174 [Paraurantiacibacter namhicola]
MAAIHPQADVLGEALRKELQAGERLLWHDKPQQRLSLMGFSIWLFAIPWTAFALFWTGMAYAGISTTADSDGPALGLLAYAFPLFGVPFIVVGLCMLAAPLAPLFLKQRQVFGITNRRLLIITKLRATSVESFRLERLGSIKRVEHKDGSGHLSIMTGTGHDSDGDKTTETAVVGRVPRIAAVEATLRDAMERRQREL